MIFEKNVSKEAEEKLSDVPEEKHFVTKEGSRLKNLHDLKHALKDMNHATFKHHVSHDKNDFHDWVKHTHQDHELAKNIKHARTPEELHEHVSDRIESLNNIKKKKLRFLAKCPLNMGSFDFFIGIFFGIIIGLIIAQIVL